MQNELEILRLLNILVTDVSELKGDVGVLKTKVSGLEQDMAEVKANVAILNQDMVEVKAKVSNLGQNMTQVQANVNHLLNVTAKMEVDFNNKIDALFSAYDVNENIHQVLSSQIADLKQKSDDQRNRLIALELNYQAN